MQEIDHKTNRTYRYIYSHPNSYEPLAQLVFAKDNENPTACYYYHNDQIGVPRELTDEDGNLCWYGDYTGWGNLKDEYALVENIHQPFRLQNQYADEETGLHYNFFRYYEPNIGRFTQLDPIGLLGGHNLYRLAGNIQKWIDVLGLNPNCFAGYSGEQLQNLALKAEADEYIQAIQERASPQPPTLGEYSKGVELSGDVASFGGVGFSVGYITSQNEQKLRNKCGFINMCAGVGSAGGKVAISGIYSSSKTTSGISLSSCVEGVGAALGGVTLSRCEDLQNKTSSTSFGVVGGAQIGVNVKQCAQLTYCSNFE